MLAAVHRQRFEQRFEPNAQYANKPAMTNFNMMMLNRYDVYMMFTIFAIGFCVSMLKFTY